MIADQLGVSISTVEEMSPQEFAEWHAFFKIRNDEEKKASKRAKRGGKSGRGRTPW